MTLSHTPEHSKFHVGDIADAIVRRVPGSHRLFGPTDPVFAFVKGVPAEQLAALEGDFLDRVARASVLLDCQQTGVAIWSPIEALATGADTPLVRAGLARLPTPPEGGA